MRNKKATGTSLLQDGSSNCQLIAKGGLSLFPYQLNGETMYKVGIQNNYLIEFGIIILLKHRVTLKICRLR